MDRVVALSNTLIIVLWVIWLIVWTAAAFFVKRTQHKEPLGAILYERVPVVMGFLLLVLPMRHPLPLAKELATLHNLSGGRLILGVGVGWLEPEFAALGVPFHERGRRMDEGIAMMRAVWTQDPVTFKAKYIAAEIEGLTMQPQPVSPIPLWIGGSSEPALARTVRIADGWHGSGLTPEKAAPLIKRLRGDRPDDDFTISIRWHWDGKDAGVLRAHVDAFAAVGVQHLLVGPVNRDVDDWDGVIEGVGRLIR